jgi:glucokinase
VARDAAPGGAPAAVGVDVGGTKILAGLVTADGAVLRAERRRTPADGDALVAEVVAAVEALRDGAGADLPVGCGYPGLVTREGLARYGPNVGMAEYPLGDALRERLRTDRVVVDNDANAAAWGEFRVGAGQAVRDTMVLYTLGTGVGGGLVVGGRLHRGAHGFAGELGHVVLRVGGAPGPSGIDGTLEAYSSGTAIGRTAAERHARGDFDGTPLEGPEPPDGAAVTAAAEAGVAAAVEVLADAGRHLGIAAAGLVNVLDPELVVVGGGAGAAGELVLGPARAALAAHVLGPGHRPAVPVVPAALGERAGLVGAALLALAAGTG